MKSFGTYKLRYRTTPPVASYLDPFGYGPGRSQRVIDSLRCQILEGGPDQSLQIRQVFTAPREIFRIEIQQADPSYRRTILVDRDALEDLLETEGVRERITQLYDAPS
ncbi:MAG: hypothetical protein VCC04_08820 [Myxococcota bacterium]